MSTPTLYNGPAITVTFEDHGQDFIEWDIAANGVVVGCRPFQADIWCGYVINGKPSKGERIQLIGIDHRVICIKYPLTKVVKTRKVRANPSTAVLNCKKVSRQAKGLLNQFKKQQRSGT
jgi:hypothetical protein